jgi:hypothetical protein
LFTVIFAKEAMIAVVDGLALLMVMATMTTAASSSGTSYHSVYIDESRYIDCISAI